MRELGGDVGTFLLDDPLTHMDIENACVSNTYVYIYIIYYTRNNEIIYIYILYVHTSSIYKYMYTYNVSICEPGKKGVQLKHEGNDRGMDT
jgi:hypothetical protein